MLELSGLSQKGCNDLLKKLGFFKKKHMGVDVPEEYLHGPYGEVKYEEDAPDVLNALPEQHTEL